MKGFDNRRSRVHQSERIAGLDHAFEPVGGLGLTLKSARIVSNQPLDRDRAIQVIIVRLVDELLVPSQRALRTPVRGCHESQRASQPYPVHGKVPPGMAAQRRLRRLLDERERRRRVTGG